MLTAFYGTIFAASLICAAIYIYMWHKHFDVNFTMIFTLVPIACLGYLRISLARSLDEALLSQQIIYIGGSFLQLFIVFSIFYDVSASDSNTSLDIIKKASETIESITTNPVTIICIIS